jgi:hypothetical protein
MRLGRPLGVVLRSHHAASCTTATPGVVVVSLQSLGEWGRFPPFFDIVCNVLVLLSCSEVLWWLATQQSLTSCQPATGQRHYGEKQSPSQILHFDRSVSMATIQHAIGTLLLNHVFAYVARLGSNNSNRKEMGDRNLSRISCLVN